MAAPVDVAVRARLDLPPAELWPFLSDTDRLNRLVDLPVIRFVPHSDPALKGHYQAETHVFGMLITYEEFPFEWVEPELHCVYRRFHGGPFTEFKGGLRLKPAGGGTEVEVFATLTPRRNENAVSLASAGAAARSARYTGELKLLR